MTRYRLSKRADHDLDDIWRRIAPDNQSAADKLIDEITSAFAVLAWGPGQPVTSCPAGYGATPSGTI